MISILSTETQIDNSSLRYFRQQAPRALADFFLVVRRSARDLWTNRVRLPELDEDGRGTATGQETALQWLE